MNSSVVGPRRSSKALSKAKLAHTPKKKKTTGHCLVVCCPSNPLQLSEFWKYHYIQEVCSGNLRCIKDFNTCSLQWSTERGQIFSNNIPNTQHNQCFRSWMVYEIVPHPPYSPDLLPTDYHVFKHLDNFLQRKCFHNQQDAENAFLVFFQSWSMDFYATGMNKLFLIGKKKVCWL